MHRRQGLLPELTIRRSLEPAHAGDGEVRLILGEYAQLPAIRTRPAGFVNEIGQRLNERQVAPASAEWITPILRIAISAGLDEILELAICHLVLVQKIIG